MIQKQIWEKIAKGEKLNPQEQFEFMQFGERLQNLEANAGGITRSGTGELFLRSPRIASPQWELSPLQTFFAYMQTDMTIANATNRYVDFDSNQETNWLGNIFSATYDPGNGTRIMLDKNKSGMAFHVGGFAIWTANATGYRAAWMESFDKDGNFLHSYPLHTAAGHNLIDNVLPISAPWLYYGTESYIKFKVHQTSGGDLALKEFLVGVSVA